MAPALLLHHADSPYRQTIKGLDGAEPLHTMRARAHFTSQRKTDTMWRAFFLAVGVYMLLLGGQCLGVQKFTLKVRDAPVVKQALDGSGERTVKPGAKKVVQPRPFVPWSLMSTGAVVCLYSFTLPRRWNG